MVHDASAWYMNEVHHDRTSSGSVTICGNVYLLCHFPGISSLDEDFLIDEVWKTSPTGLSDYANFLTAKGIAWG
ncbi:hypothetical protein T4A_390 [Trichinella pseudospiralis]|uniref:Uncharacterized protein n=1 Tax=Trichinella pseudospiralis TaxID=6337 RepID=A0A0V1EDP1_TRIPS|nr:hypothetical protein T4A_390 [Trichinella pseudospiralis]